MKQKIAKVLCMALFLSLVAGCGNAAQPETGPVEETTAAAETTAAETEKEAGAGETETGTQDQEKNAQTENAATDDASADREVRVTALKGPTAMGLVELMERAQDQAVNGNRYTFTIAASVDEVTPRLVQGETDIAAVPANLASVFYNNTEGQVRVLAVNTLGVLYIVDTGDAVHTVEDLRGKTIYASGKGAVPEYALNYVLSSNGLDPEKDVTVEWKSEHSECVAALAASAGDSAIALLPQPFVTTAQARNEKLRIALDLTQEWDRANERTGTQGALIMGVVVARTDFLEENPEAVNAFLDSYKESVDFVNGDVEAASQLIEKFDIVPAAVAQKAIPYCNIVLMEGAEMKESFSGYLNALFEQNPKSIGEKIPEDDFYYSR